MKKTTLVISVLCLFNLMSLAQTKRLTNSDRTLMIGKWSGSLTYLDYSSAKSFSMPANVEISESGTKNLIFDYKYPNEPKANVADTITIEKGRIIDGFIVVSRAKKPGGYIEIVTEKSGVDGNDNKPAVLRYTYLVSDTSLIKRKQVKFERTDNWILRNEFNFRRR